MKSRRKQNRIEDGVKVAMIEWLIANGGFVWNNETTGIYDPRRQVFRKRVAVGRMNGTSDIIGIWRGRPLAIEVKRPKTIDSKDGYTYQRGYASKDQKEFISNFKAHHGLAFVAYSVEQVADTLLPIPPLLDILVNYPSAKNYY